MIFRPRDGKFCADICIVHGWRNKIIDKGLFAKCSDNVGVIKLVVMAKNLLSHAYNADTVDKLSLLSWPCYVIHIITYIYLWYIERYSLV